MRQSDCFTPNVLAVVLQSMREFSGRLAGVGYSAVVVGITVTGRAACAKISDAKSAQLTLGFTTVVIGPSFRWVVLQVLCNHEAGTSDATRWRRPTNLICNHAQSVSVSDICSMVFTKLEPCAETTQEVRKMAWVAPLPKMPASPTNLLRPYAFCGAVVSLGFPRLLHPIPQRHNH